MSEALNLDELIALGEKATARPWVLNQTSCDLGCCDDLQKIVASYPGEEVGDREIGIIYGGNAVWLKAGEAEANARLAVAACNAAVPLAKRLKRIGELLRPALNGDDSKVRIVCTIEVGRELRELLGDGK